MLLLRHDQHVLLEHRRVRDVESELGGLLSSELCRLGKRPVLTEFSLMILIIVRI